ncbi:NERD domain protein (plasmid) [Cylindrospermum sp. NIES-4074]|nr:NERD domain protein [Cylindrospermum sp. NIES-4074]
MNTLKLAKQGDSQAIATLMSKALQPKGIMVQVSIKNEIITVVAESTEVLDQSFFVDYVRKAIKKLKLPAIKRLYIWGQVTGNKNPVWRQTINLQENQTLSTPIVNTQIEESIRIIMRNLQQSPSLTAAFQQKIDAKKYVKHQEIHQVLGNGILGGLGSFMYEFKQAKNKFQGNMGEWGISAVFQHFPDTWVMFNNALIPTNNSGILTEVDHLIIGLKGVFLLEVKTWKGSFSAYNDKWKRREGSNWVAISNSPTSQSAYHQQMFSQWITSLVPNLPDNFVYAPVVFPIAKWLGVNNCSVPVFHGVPGLIQTMVNCPECLTATQVQSIAEAVANYTLPENATPTPKPIPKPKLIKRQNPSS